MHDDGQAIDGLVEHVVVITTEIELVVEAALDGGQLVGKILDFREGGPGGVGLWGVLGWVIAVLEVDGIDVLSDALLEPLQFKGSLSHGLDLLLQQFAVLLLHLIALDHLPPSLIFLANNHILPLHFFLPLLSQFYFLRQFLDPLPIAAFLFLKFSDFVFGLGVGIDLIVEHLGQLRNLPLQMSKLCIDCLHFKRGTIAFLLYFLVQHILSIGTALSTQLLHLGVLLIFRKLSLFIGDNLDQFGDKFVLLNGLYHPSFSNYNYSL